MLQGESARDVCQGREAEALRPTHAQPVGGQVVTFSVWRDDLPVQLSHGLISFPAGVDRYPALSVDMEYREVYMVLMRR